MKIISAKNMLKTEGKLSRNNFGTLEITDNRLGRKFFQVGSVISKAFLTHLPVTSTNIFQDRASRRSLGNSVYSLTAYAVEKFFLKSILILQFKLFISGLTLCEHGREIVLFLFAAHFKIFKLF